MTIENTTHAPVFTLLDRIARRERNRVEMGDIRKAEEIDRQFAALLAALENIIACMDANDGDSLANAAFAARAALAQARGE